jgi:hypothetical protein
MQIQYSAVAAGNGSNPKSPPPVSLLLKQYILCALRVQETVDHLFEDPINEVLVYVIRSQLETMLSIYDRMNQDERDIVEGSHIPPETARSMRFRINHVMTEANIDLLPNLGAELSTILYTTRHEACTLH